MSGVLVGRGDELERVGAWLAGRAVGSGPPALLVAGEAGIGKTALLHAATAALSGQNSGGQNSGDRNGGGQNSGGQNSGGQNSGGQNSGGQNSGGQNSGGQNSGGQNSGGQNSVVRRCAASPWRTTPFGLLSQVLGERVPSEPAGVREGLLALARGRPLIVVLDDLHWSDDASLQLLGPVIEGVTGDPVALLGAYRSDELPRTHLMRPLRARLRQRGAVAEVALGPLPAEGVAELVTTLVGPCDPALVRAIGERTEGVPFFVEELTAALAASGRLTAGDDLPLPETIRDAVLLRTSGLSEPARAALDVAAVVGVAFDVPSVSAVDGTDWPDELDDSGLVITTGADRRRFRHALTQEAIYSEVPWSRRRDLHQAIAARATDPAVAARHLLAARDFDRARPLLLAAAERHEQAYAYRDAARLLTEALEIWPVVPAEPVLVVEPILPAEAAWHLPPGELSGSVPVGELERLAVVDRLARCAELSGDSTLAVTSLRELASALLAAQPAAMTTSPAADVQRRLALQYERLGHWPAALAARETAAAAYTRGGFPAEAAAERLAVAAHLRSAASFRAALAVLDRAAADAAEAGRADLACRAAGLRGNVLARMGRADVGVPLVRDALGRALSGGLAVTAAEIYQRLADSLEHSGDYRAAGRAYESAYEFCTTNDLDGLGQLCRACATVVMFHRGRWDRATTLCAGVLDDPSATAHARTVASGVLGLVRALRGQGDAARDALLESRTSAVAIDLVAMEILSTWGLALLDEAGGRPDRAAQSYRHVIERCRETEESHYCVPVLQFAVARFATDRERAGLAAATALLGEVTARTGQAEAEAAFAYAIGECAAHDDGPRAAVPHLNRAIGLLDGLHLPIVDVLIRQRLGVLLAGSDEGRSAHDQARSTARRLRARALTDRLGAAPAPTPGLLTERETQIMGLVGEGLTSRAIGTRLFLSVRTVEMHVRNAVAKLGCRTRAEAVKRLEQAGA